MMQLMYQGQKLKWITPLQKQCIYSTRSPLKRRLLSFKRDLFKWVKQVSIDESNYASRSLKDLNGDPLNPNPSLIVIHETVYGVN